MPVCLLTTIVPGVGVKSIRINGLIVRGESTYA
jgi:hypothetical protein